MNMFIKKAGNKMPPAVKSVIDTHVHVVTLNLPGVALKKAPDGTSFQSSPEQLAKVIQAELQEANIEHALCMPSPSADENDPLGVEGTRRLAALVPGLHPVGFANPERVDERHIDKVEESLRHGDVVALKAYLGYIHHYPNSPGYHPYYRLAAKYKIPVVFHSGDTYSHLAKLKFAHPFNVDEVAVDFPETNFVIAHLGNPWLVDTAEVVYKNNKPGIRENVWADLSGLMVGSAADYENYRQEGYFEVLGEKVREVIDFTDRPDRFLYGSDWPLSPMKIYRDFIGELIPESFHQAIFHDNAKSLFKLK